MWPIIEIAPPDGYVVPVARSRWRVVLGAIVVAGALTGCGVAPGPAEPSTTGTPTPSVTGAPSVTPGATPTATPSATLAGLTLRQLGFENGPLEEFSLPGDLAISTRVDQPNLVTVIVSRPSPQTIEDYLRATLPGEGFTIDARAGTGAAMTFAGHGWTGGFTGTRGTSAIVLRPS